MLKPRTTAQNQADILANLTTTGIRQLAPGGKARALGDALGYVAATIEQQQYQNLQDVQLPTATGVDLDAIGEAWGVIRIPESSSVSYGTENNVQFYVVSGTFGAINNGQPMTVPAGTKLSTLAGDNGPTFVTTSSVTLAADQSQASVDVISLSSGTAGNLTMLSLVEHNFVNYADSAAGSLLVRNNYGVIGGQDQEGDDNYRYRIQLRLKARDTSNDARIREELLPIPGVQDVVLSDQPGFLTVYLYGVSPLVPPSLLTTAQIALENVLAYPVKGTVLTPDLVGISLSTTITLVAGTAPADQPSILAAATQAAANYINNLGVNNPLVINDLSRQISQSDARILDVGQPNAPLDAIYIWRSRVDGSRYSRFLIANYQPALGERLLAELSLTSPITITVAG